MPSFLHRENQQKKMSDVPLNYQHKIKNMRILQLLFAILLCTTISCSAQSSKYKSVDANQFEQVVANDAVVCIDVRTAGEYATGHLSKAINIDVQKEDFERQVLATVPTGKSVAVYCRSGKRSKKAADILAAKGYTVTELNTGINGWNAAGKATAKDAVDLFFTPKGTAIYFYCLKHGSLRFQVGDQWVYVDPVTTAVPPVTDYSNMPKADFILITHNHFDHLDTVAIQQLMQESTKIYSNTQSGNTLKSSIALKNGSKKTLANGWVLEAVPAYNNSADKKQFHPKGRDNGYILMVDGFRIYIAGDTEDIPEMKSVKNIDVAFLPCNLPFTMTPEQLAKAAKLFNPKVLFPYHYGETDIQQVVNLLKDTKIDVRIRQYQ